MNLLAIASDPLRPFLERLLPRYPHTLDLAYRTTDALSARGYDAVLLLDGAQAVSDEGLSLPWPFVIPRVHNPIALLLGSAARYRALFDRFGGGLCWMPAGLDRPVFTAPMADCACLCSLVDTELGLPDPTVAAMACAQQNGWDHLSAACSLTLLSRLLAGEWQGEQILCAPAGSRVLLSYDRALLTLAE